MEKFLERVAILKRLFFGLVILSMVVSTFSVAIPKAAGNGYAPQPGDVIINEFATNPGGCAGPGMGPDEWHELLNTTGNGIDLTGWSIQRSFSPNISLSGTIPPHGLLTFSALCTPANDTGDVNVLEDNTSQWIYALSYGNQHPDDMVHSAAPASGGSAIYDSGTWHLASSVNVTKGWFNPPSGAPTMAELDSTIESSADVVTNFGDIGDATRASGLYFEKAGLGKITFNGTLNLTDPDTIALLQNLGDKLQMAQDLENQKEIIGLDASTDQVLKDAGASLEMYGLDGLGFSDAVPPEITVKDDLGVVILPGNEEYPDITDVSYDEENNNGTLAFSTGHFTAFETSKNVYVDNSNEGEEDGTWAYPYNTIQEGVNNAPEGWIVQIINSDIYNEAVTVDKALTLQGYDVMPTVSNDAGPVITINAPSKDVYIENLSIDCHTTGVQVIDGSAIINKNNIGKFEGCTYFIDNQSGISADGRDNYYSPSIWRSTISGMMNGSVLWEPYYLDTDMTTSSHGTPEDVYVDNTYAAFDSGGHFWGYDAFETIQDGIDNVLSGGTVHVYKGDSDYSENLTINQPVTLLGDIGTDDVGAGPNAPVIIDDSGGNTRVVNISASGVVFRGFVIGDNSGYPAIRIATDITTTTIKNNDLHNAYSGVQLAPGASDNTITKNKIYENYYGLFINGSTNNTFSHNEIYSSNSNGIEIAPNKSADGNNINNNNIHNNSGKGINIGHDVSASEGPIIIKENIIDANVTGITIGSSAVGVSIIGNTITDNLSQASGIEIYSTDQVAVHQNIISGNGNIGSGLDNFTTDVLDATRNYWGNASGPYNATANPGGGGDSVSDYVNFEPFFTDSDRTILSDYASVPITDLTPVDFSVPIDVTDATIDVSPLISGLSGEIPGMTLGATTSFGDIGVTIPAGTIITGEAGWTGVINMPTVKPNNSVTVSNGNVSEVIEIGFGNIKLTFDQGVRLLFNGKGGKRIGYSRDGVFTQITDPCTDDSQATGNALDAGTDCKINVNNDADLVVWTKHFTSFIIYTPYSGGGGGGGSYSPSSAAPTNVSLSIAGGADSTNNANVTLTMGATGASDMMISNNSDFSGASWETYATSKSWALTTGDGTKTVYAKFKSSTGDVSSIVSDSITLTTSLIAPSPPSQQNAQQMAGQYDYQFVSESAFPTLLNSATVDMTITLKNTGTATWSNTGANPVRLGTNRPMDRNCGFKTDTGWLSTNRIAMDQATVAPNANATFTFKVAKNSIPQGAYREYFRPVVENINWMKDIGIYWEIKVISPANQYDYEFISQSAYPQIAVGGTSGLWLRLKNTGTATWDQSTVRLGTAKPLDRTSAFFDTDAASYPNPKWVTQNRIRMEQTTVAPGENADFVFYVKVPASAKAGTYKEYFRPVVENIGWLRDIGIYWSIKVK